MIYILYSTSCSVCKRTVRFFRNNHIPFTRIILGEDRIEREMLNKILSLCENGFETIISLKTDRAKKLGLDREKFLNISTNEMIEIIQEDSSLLKRPIVFQTTSSGIPYRMQIGYEPEDLKIFLRKVNGSY